DDVPNRTLHALIQPNQKIDGRRTVAIDCVQELAQPGPRGFRRETGRQLFTKYWIVGEGHPLGIRFKKKVERVDNYKVSDEVNFDGKVVYDLRKDHARQIVILRVLLPIDKMAVRLDP